MADSISSLNKTHVSPLGMLYAPDFSAYYPAIREYGGAMSSALSEAAARYAESVEELHAQGIHDAEREFQAACDAFADAFDDLSAKAKTWADAAENARNPGIANIMRNYADGFAAKAESLLSDVGSAAGHWGALAADAQKGLEDAGKLFGGAAGKWAGPVVDGAQMLAGAWEWAKSGESATFGQACSGVLFSAGGGLLFASGVGLLTAAAPAIAAAAGIGALAGALIGGSAFDAAKDQLGKWVGEFGEWSGFFPGLADLLSDQGGNGLPDSFDRARQALVQAGFYTSPIVLDLDGDGIETQALGLGTHFDLNADGFAEATGWVGQGDGLLVLDRNGNGVIDDGRELFGDGTLLANGTDAANGFVALKELDINQDGMLDETDEAFGRLGIWCDTNSNGHSESNELISLATAGVSAINTAYSTSSLIDAAGNAHKQIGTFVHNDGTNGTLADVWFSVNRANSFSMDRVDVPEEIARLPFVRGFGIVSDIHQAMARDETGELKTLVESFGRETDTSKRGRIVQQILAKWTEPAAEKLGVAMGASTTLTSTESHLFVAHSFMGEAIVSAITRRRVQLIESAYREISEYVYSELMAQTHLAPYLSSLRFGWDETSQQWKGDASGLVSSLLVLSNTASGLASTLATESQRVLRGLGIDRYFDLTSLESKNLSGDVGDDTLVGGLFADQLRGEAGNDTLDGGTGNDRLIGGDGSDTYLFGLGSGQDTVDNYHTDTAVDTIRLGSGLTLADITLSGAGNDLLLRLADGAELRIQNWFYGGSYAVRYQGLQIATEDGTTVSLADLLKAQTAFVWATTDNAEIIQGIAGNDIIAGRGGNDALYGNDGADTLEGGEGADWLDGGVGNDTLAGGAGNDVLYGGADADTLEGGDGSDTLYGGTGNDALSGAEGGDALYGEAGNDTLAGGDGNDRLIGGDGSDTYLFGLGSGQDTVDNYHTDTAVDTIRLGSGLTLADITLSGVGADLLLTLPGETDQLRIQGWFFSSSRQGFQIAADDGTTVSLADLLKAQTAFVWATTDNAEIIQGIAGNDIIAGRGGNDVLYGNDGADTLEGGEGSDTLYGNAGGDTLTGGDADDQLYGGNGNDTLAGGTGNDYLEGGLNSDTYLFNLGDGQDTIYNYAAETAGSGKVDVLQFGPDIDPAAVSVTKSRGNLVLAIAGTADKVTVQGYFSFGNYALDQIRFADGSSCDAQRIKETAVTLGAAGSDNIIGYDGAANRMYGLDGDDILYGGNGSDLIDGGNGADSLYGGAGNDTLAGGAGNDAMNGGTGNDTYLLDRGYGADTVTEYDATAANTDRAQFGADIAADQIWFRHVGNNLEASIIGTADSLTIQNWYSGSAYHVDQFRTVDGRLLLDTQVENLVQAMAAFAPPAAGQTTLPQNYQDSLAPVIAANWQ